MPNLAEFQDLASVATERSVTLSSGSVALFRSALEYMENLYNWQGQEQILSDGEIEYIQDTVDTAVYELTREVQPVATDLLYCVATDTKTTNQAGGSSVANAWTARPVNTIDAGKNTIGATISNGGVLLPVGVYHVSLEAHFSFTTGASRVRMRMHNNTGSGGVFATGTNYAPNAGQIGIVYPMVAIVSIVNATYPLLFQYWTNVARATDGLGVPMNQTLEGEEYVRATILKVG